MKTEKRRVLALALLGALTLASCGEAVSVTDTSSADSTTEPTVETQPEIISHALPKKDYSGHEFRILTTDSKGALDYSFEIDTEELNGDALNDAVYNRNTAVEDAYGITITQILEANSSLLSLFSQSVMAGDDSYDVLVHTADKIMQNGYLYGLAVEDLPYIDTSREYWDSVIMDQAALGGVNYGMAGSINLVDDNATWTIFFNKELAKENKVEDLYALVYDGKWTLDVMKKICSDLTRDINGDSKVDYLDQWGMVASGNSAAAMLWPAGGMLGTLEDDGSLTLTINSERNINALMKIYDIFSSGQVLITNRDIPSKVDDLSNWNYAYKVFNESRALFFGGCLNSLNQFRDMDADFGFLPNPKYDEAQDGYISTTQEWKSSMWMVPRTAPDPERTSVILEAMASSAEYYIIPAFYDVQLTRKRARDDESEAILDILFENRVFDLVYTFNFGGARSIANALMKTTNTITSELAALEPWAQTVYEDIYQSILDAE